MKALIAKLAKAALLKFATDPIMIDLTVRHLRTQAAKTTNQVDDYIVAMVANALTTPPLSKKCCNTECENKIDSHIDYCSENCLINHELKETFSSATPADPRNHRIY